MKFAVGSIVRARGREWVVQPESQDDIFLLRPLGGTEGEIAGVLPALESVEPAAFDLPDPSKLGDHLSCRLLRDAVRLGFRSSAGPFRSFGHLAFEPRPYQLVPLLLGLRQSPVRLLIADDVGIGKTIEACLVVRELLDRGEICRFAVLCPPQLAEQWQAELKRKFNLDVELVLPSTATRLERGCRMGQSLFEVYPHVVVSTDFIKSDRRRDDFLRTCPELVVVDEAHTCAFDAGARSSRHQRHQLIQGLVADEKRHVVLVTATPHSGNPETFRSLVTLLDPSLADLPLDLAGKQNEAHRRRLAQFFVQRRRGDLRHFMQADTPFPEREEKEVTYKLSAEYKKLFEKVLAYARETVCDAEGGAHHQRVRWWSALALLRSLASSPAAAAATLRTRAGAGDTDQPEEADLLGQRAVLDLEEGEASESPDVAPGGDATEFSTDAKRNRERLMEMARDAEALKGNLDEKLLKAVAQVKELLAQGFRPIVFCRFIPTAEYLAAELRSRLPKKVEVAAVTGDLPPADREQRIGELHAKPDRVLVCTDCLSEGINLQEHFDAVVHYDLSWNPTRHEQREGRVDRFGQRKGTVRVVTCWGLDNQIDGIVLDVLIQKHKKIRNALGISVPVPVNTNQLIEAIFEGLLLKSRPGNAEQQLLMFEEYFKPKREVLHTEWEVSAEREKRSRTMFAQEGIKADEVARELQAVRAAIGSGVDVGRFWRESMIAHRAVVAGEDPVQVELSECPRALREAFGERKSLSVRFSLPVQEGVEPLDRTHPWVESLAGYVMDTALDMQVEAVARRCGVIRTKQVAQRTTVLLLRFRYHILTRRGEAEIPLLAEDCLVAAFVGSPDAPTWLDEAEAEKLLAASPDANISPDQARDFLQEVVAGHAALLSRLNELGQQRGTALLGAHQRVRQAVQLKGIKERVEPILPPDLLGIFVYLPAGAR
ncbi:MAG TPA: helicase-related protein [Myxococcota bacterium]|nr:helicase-related protein [Myxococcota bacterium]HRY93595.1 helicase-related protein [Myxococcota bacterium]